MRICRSCRLAISADDHIATHHIERCFTDQKVKAEAQSALSVMHHYVGCNLTEDLTIRVVECLGCGLALEDTRRRVIQHTIECDRPDAYSVFEARQWITEYEAIHAGATESEAGRQAHDRMKAADIWALPKMHRNGWRNQAAEIWADVLTEILRVGYGGKVRQARGLTGEEWGEATAMAAEDLGAPVSQCFTACSLRVRAGR
jgi:hypothetical protein